MRVLLFWLFGIVLAYTAIGYGAYAWLYAPSPVFCVITGCVLIAVGSSGYFNPREKELRPECALFILVGSASVYGAITVPIGGAWYAPWTWPVSMGTSVFLLYGFAFLFAETFRPLYMQRKKKRHWQKCFAYFRDKNSFR